MHMGGQPIANKLEVTSRLRHCSLKYDRYMETSFRHKNGRCIQVLHRGFRYVKLRAQLHFWHHVFYHNVVLYFCTINNVDTSYCKCKTRKVYVSLNTTWVSCKHEERSKEGIQYDFVAQSLVARAGLSKCGARLEALLPGPTQSRRHGGFGGFIPPKQSTKPQIETWNTKSIKFLSIFRMTNHPAQTQSPPIENLLPTVLAPLSGVCRNLWWGHRVILIEIGDVKERALWRDTKLGVCPLFHISNGDFDGHLRNTQ